MSLPAPWECDEPLTPAQIEDWKDDVAHFFVTCFWWAVIGGGLVFLRWWYAYRWNNL